MFDDLSLVEPLQEMFASFLDFVPKVLLFGLILFVGMFIARMIRKAVSTVLRRVKFDSYIDKAGIGGPLARAGFADSGEFLAKIVYYMIGLIVLQLALDKLGSNPISDLLNDFIAWIPKLIVAMIIIIVTGLVANFVRDLLGGMLANNPQGPLLTNIAVYGVWIMGVLAALDQAQFASDIVDTLTTALFGSLSAIMIIKYGVGGIWSARDRFWPGVYDKMGGLNK